MYQYLDAKPVLSKMAAPFVVVFFPFCLSQEMPSRDQRTPFVLVALWSMTVCMKHVRDYSLFVHR